MAEATADVYANAAGLLRNLGHSAEVDEAFTPHPSFRERGPFVALVTDADPVLVGYAISQVAEEPEPHLPTRSAKVARPRHWEPGDPQFAWWV